MDLLNKFHDLKRTGSHLSQVASTLFAFGYGIRHPTTKTTAISIKASQVGVWDSGWLIPATWTFDLWESDKLCRASCDGLSRVQ